MNRPEISHLGITFERTRQPKPRPEGEFGFGRFFTDHLFFTDYKSDTGWQHARVMPYQALQIDPGASVLHYGQAIFEGLKAFYGVDGRVRLFRPLKNWQRMTASAERLCMPMIDENLFIDGLKALVRADFAWIPQKMGTALYLRPTLIGTESFLGVRPSETYSYYVMASPVGSYYGGNAIEPVKIWVERKFSRAAPGGIGSAKAGGNYASSLKAAAEAKRRGFAQVLWLDAAEKRFVEEVGTMNVFFVVGDRVLTPPLAGTILPGVTRLSVIELLARKGVQVEERPIEIDEIIQAQRQGQLKEAFGTGTAASISPVGALGVGGESLIVGGGKIGPIAADLYAMLNDIQYGRAPDEMGWNVEVDDL